MASSYQIVTQRPFTQYLGGTNTQDGVLVGFTTKPSAIYGEVFVPQDVYASGGPEAPVLSLATILETVAGLDNVSDVTYGQRQNASGILIPQVTITVSSTSGNSAAQLTYDISALGPKLHQANIDALHQKLDAAEAA